AGRRRGAADGVSPVGSDRAAARRLVLRRPGEALDLPAQRHRGVRAVADGYLPVRAADADEAQARTACGGCRDGSSGGTRVRRRSAIVLFLALGTWSLGAGAQSASRSAARGQQQAYVPGATWER